MLLLLLLLLLMCRWSLSFILCLFVCAVIATAVAAAAAAAAAAAYWCCLCSFLLSLLLFVAVTLFVSGGSVYSFDCGCYRCWCRHLLLVPPLFLVSWCCFLFLFLVFSSICSSVATIADATTPVAAASVFLSSGGIIYLWCCEIGCCCNRCWYGTCCNRCWYGTCCYCCCLDFFLLV